MAMKGHIQTASDCGGKSILAGGESTGTCIQASTPDQNLRKRGHAIGSHNLDPRPKKVGVHGAVESPCQAAEAVSTRVGD